MGLERAFGQVLLAETADAEISYQTIRLSRKQRLKVFALEHLRHQSKCCVRVLAQDLHLVAADLSVEELPVLSFELRFVQTWG